MQRFAAQAALAFRITLVFVLISSVSLSCRPSPPEYAGSNYIVIGPEFLIDAASELVSLKESQGFLVETVSLESILATMPGEDDAEKVRNYLAGSLAPSEKEDFVLLLGSMATMPMRIAHTDPTDHSSYDVPTDYYYQELSCDWDADGDGVYGEWEHDMTRANCDYRVEAWAGRLPWDTPSEIEEMVAAILAYDTDDSDRMKTALGAAAVIGQPCDAATFLDLAQKTDMMLSGYRCTTLYEQCPSLNPDFELTRSDFLGQWEALQPGFVAWFSHGDAYGSYSYYGGTPFIDVAHLPQGVAPAIAVTSGCVVGAPEVESLGRMLVREGVAAGFVGSSRVTFMGSDPGPAYQAQYQMLRNLILRRQALSAAVANAVAFYVDHEEPVTNISGPAFNQNVFEFMIYGDPALQAR